MAKTTGSTAGAKATGTSTAHTTSAATSASTTMDAEAIAELLRVADVARIPRDIFLWFSSDANGFKTLAQIASIRESDVELLSKHYQQQKTPEKADFSIFVGINLNRLVAWLSAYRNITGSYPATEYITAETFEDPSMGIPNNPNQYPMTPGSSATPERNFIYQRLSSPYQGTGYTGGSSNRRNVKVSIT